MSCPSSTPSYDAPQCTSGAGWNSDDACFNAGTAIPTFTRTVTCNPVTSGTLGDGAVVFGSAVDNSKCAEAKYVYSADGQTQLSSTATGAPASSYDCSANNCAQCPAYAWGAGDWSGGSGGSGAPVAPPVSPPVAPPVSPPAPSSSCSDVKSLYYKAPDGGNCKLNDKGWGSAPYYTDDACSSPSPCS